MLWCCGFRGLVLGKGECKARHVCLEMRRASAVFFKVSHEAIV